MHDFERWFREHFGASAPVGYCLRADHSDRWLRLHSLPESKRYAKDDAERAEVRRRAWAAASEVLPAGSLIWLVVPYYEEELKREPLDQSLSLRFERIRPYEHDLLEVPLVAHVAQTTWPHAAFDQLIDKFAKYLGPHPVWFSQTSGEVFAPYDGGIDLIVESPRRSEALQSVFPLDWFSKHASGL